MQIVTFTLDTNCLIDLAEERPAAGSVRALVAASEEGKADLALVASSASERQMNGDFLKSVDAFNERRVALGLGSLPLLPSIARWGVSFFGQSLWGSKENSARERKIYEVLFPSSQVEWSDYAAARSVDIEDYSSSAYLRWRNQLLDAQALWAHDYATREVFVTSDRRLMRLNGHEDFPKIAVCTPEESARLLQTSDRD